MEGHLSIRKAEESDLRRIMEIFDIAKEFMHSTGNTGQWNGAYPGEKLILSEIGQGHCFVVTEIEGRIVGTFCFIIGEDPTYRVIEDGEWLDDEPYGTIHRIASDRTEHGIGHLCISFCSSLIGTLRADTHRDNAPMLSLLEKEGFIRCGIIHLADGAPRIAFQRPSARNKK